MYGQATLDITGQQICCHILLFLFKQSQVAIDIEQPLVPCVFICPPRSCQSGPKRVGGSRWVVTEARCGGSMLAMKLPPPCSYKQFVTQEKHAIILSIYPKRYFEYQSNRMCLWGWSWRLDGGKRSMFGKEPPCCGPTTTQPYLHYLSHQNTIFN